MKKELLNRITNNNKYQKILSSKYIKKINISLSIEFLAYIFIFFNILNLIFIAMNNVTSGVNVLYYLFLIVLYIILSIVTFFVDVYGLLFLIILLELFK